MFTTKDSDNDDSWENCATKYHGAWWYENCHESHLNGEYSVKSGSNSVHWIHWKAREGLRETKMIIKPQFN